MAATTVSPLESLPLLALERICEYLDDNFDRRQSLWAFSLASRSCCAIAATHRFCQVTLEIGGENGLESLERQWTAILDPDARYRHVRRLKISCAAEKVDSRSDYVEDMDWHTQHYFDVDDFCRPSAAVLPPPATGEIHLQAVSYPEDWSILARFLGRLTGLKDLVWSSGSRIPPSVLAAVHSRGCRLHMHRFRLSSLV